MECNNHWAVIKEVEVLGEADGGKLSLEERLGAQSPNIGIFTEGVGEGCMIARTW